MFGFITKKEVNDDAVRLKTLADMAVTKYHQMLFEEACSAVKAEFPPDQRHVDLNLCSFAHTNATEFQFDIDRLIGERPLALTVHGRGKYAGFMLQTIDGGKSWRASVSDGILYRATGGAKQMLKVMQKKFSVTKMEYGR